MDAKKPREKNAIKVRPRSGHPEMMYRTIRDVLRYRPEQFYIKHPPEDLLAEKFPTGVVAMEFPDEIPELYVPWFDDQIFDLAARLRSLQKEHSTSGNGIYLLSALLLTHECKFYPPIWVLNALAASFKKYWKDPTAQSLDLLLGLTCGRGEDPPSQAAGQHEMDKNIATDIWLLQHKFDLSVDEAAEVVHLKLNPSVSMKIRWGKTRERASSTLARLYSTKWKKKFNLSKENYDYLSAHYSQEFWQHFLHSFPIDCLHNVELKKKLKLD